MRECDAAANTCGELYSFMPCSPCQLALKSHAVNWSDGGGAPASGPAGAEGAASGLVANIGDIEIVLLSAAAAKEKKNSDIIENG